MSKGSLRRKTQVDQKTMQDNWDKIFNKKKKEQECQKPKKKK